MAQIGPVVIGKIEKLIHDMLFTHMEDIDKSYMLAEEGIRVPLPITIKPGDKGLKVKVGFGPLSMGKISDAVEADMNENQTSILDEVKG